MMKKSAPALLSSAVLLSPWRPTTPRSHFIQLSQVSHRVVRQGANTNLSSAVDADGGASVDQTVWFARPFWDDARAQVGDEARRSRRM